MTQIHHCRNCGDAGHSVRTCPKPFRPKVAPTGVRKCRRCSLTGHYATTCTTDLTPRPVRPVRAFVYRRTDSIFDGPSFKGVMHLVDR